MERRSVPVAFPVKEPGVVAGLGARDVGVVCSLVGVLSLDSALGEVVLVGALQLQRRCCSATLWVPL